MTLDEFDQLYEGWDRTALCAWREARGEGLSGMQAVCCVLANRALRRKTTCDFEVLRPLQFTSMTFDRDPEIHLFPESNDAQWIQAQALAAEARAGTLPDITLGSTLYYNPRGIITKKTITLPDGSKIAFPQSWNPAMVHYATKIQQHVFFTE